MHQTQKTVIKCFFQYRLLPTHGQIYKLLGITNGLKKDFILLTGGESNPRPKSIHPRYYILSRFFM